MTRSAPTISVLLLAVTACGGDDAARSLDGSATLVRDSAGTQVVESRLAGLPVHDVATLVLEIGASGVDGVELYRVVTPFLSGDRLIVPNAGSHQMLEFGLDGTLLREAGREGDGPGEFRQIGWARPYRGDSIAVWDARLDRLTVLDSALRPARTVRPVVDAGERGQAGTITTRSVSGLTRGGERVIGLDVFPDGSILAWIGEVSVGPGDTTSVRRDRRPLMRFDPDGRPAERMGNIPDAETFVWSEGPSRSAQPLAFGRTSAVRVAGETVVVGQNDLFQLHVLGDSGRVRRVMRVADLEPASVSDADRAAFRDAAIGDLPPLFRENVERSLAAMPVPEQTPYHGDIVPAPGGVWLERYRKPLDEGAHEWVGFHADGRTHSVLRVPADMLLTWVSDTHAVAVRTDPLGVESVVVFELPVAGG